MAAKSAVPPDNQPPYPDPKHRHDPDRDPPSANDHAPSDKEGQPANIRQNTTNQGFQQDR